MRFVWCTIGTQEPGVKAVIVKAESLEAAKDKVCGEVAAGEESPEGVRKLGESYREDYGSEWFLQELADEVIGAETTSNSLSESGTLKCMDCGWTWKGRWDNPTIPDSCEECGLDRFVTIDEDGKLID